MQTLTFLVKTLHGLNFNAVFFLVYSCCSIETLFESMKYIWEETALFYQQKQINGSSLFYCMGKF